jgi:hypothetical protein
MVQYRCSTRGSSSAKPWWIWKNLRKINLS